MMTLTETMIAVPPPLRFAEDGRVIRVGDTRVSLDAIIEEYEAGASAEEIVLAYDVLNLADVHSVISYYLRHRGEVEEYLRGRRESGEESRRKHESPWPDHVRERLLARESRRSD